MGDITVPFFEAAVDRMFNADEVTSVVDLVMCLLNNSDMFIFAKGHFPGSLDLG
jgi:hypothetical protein